MPQPLRQREYSLHFLCLRGITNKVRQTIFCSQNGTVHSVHSHWCFNAYTLLLGNHLLYTNTQKLTERGGCLDEAWSGWHG